MFFVLLVILYNTHQPDNLAVMNKDFILNYVFAGVLEKALIETDHNGILTDILLMMITAIFTLQEEEEEEEQQLSKKGKKGISKIHVTLTRVLYFENCASGLGNS